MLQNNRLLFWLRLWIFWLLYFALHRVVFYSYNYSFFSEYPLSEQLQGFWEAIHLDLSTAGYLIAIPTLLLIGYIFSVKFINRLNYFFIILIGIISVTDTLLYHEWGYKLNAYALSFLFYPTQMMASITVSQLILSFLLEISLISFGIFLYKFITKIGIENTKEFVSFNFKKKITHPIFYGLVSLLAAALTFLAIRGSLGLAPINQSSAYYSVHTPLNHLATNTSWNLLFSILKANKAKKQAGVKYFEQEKVEQNLKKVYTSNPKEQQKILRYTRPNVVLVILESYTSDVVETLGGEKDIAPHFSKMTQEGLLFDNIYSTADRTDKGVVGVLSGYPAQMNSSIIKEPQKFEKLPVLPSVFKNKGYSTSVYYGGESEYANFKAYWHHAGFDEIIDQNQFEEKDKNSKWGAHDHVVFEKVIQDLNQQKPPFFTTVLTLSCHEPFETPISTPYDEAVKTETDKDKKEANLFRKAAYYADWSINKFMEEAKKQTWYEQTLFIFVADHGHRLPKLYKDTRQTEKYRIPLLFYGNAISEEFLAKRNSTIGSQTDIATTLLEQLEIDNTDFRWGKDLLNPSSKQFAFYCYDEGMTWITPKGSLRYTETTSTSQVRMKDNNVKKEELLEQLPYAKSYLQALLEDYASK
ncbi:LTA synthase family protein [Bernardetia sp.]|uniref:LTA synthase family protein n=1 Tax=Bernardetia sp. TaxID=1937974 RepID=UPI0025BCCC29|nr:alkaline phosphatase family protein [Bernardetia sp.]